VKFRVKVTLVLIIETGNKKREFSFKNDKKFLSEKKLLARPNREEGSPIIMCPIIHI